MADFSTRSKELGNLIVVGGPGGSGVSTIAKRISEHYFLNYLYGGKVMRELAKKHGFKNLDDFLESEFFKENHFDFLIDERLLEKSFTKDILIDSKVFAALATKHEIPCTVKIWIDADLDVRVERTLGKKKKKGLSSDEVRSSLQKRYEYDKKRFADLYGVEFDGQEKYNDIVVDSSKQTPDETFNFILKFIKDGGYFKSR